VEGKGFDQQPTKDSNDLDRGEMASDPPTRHNPALNIAAIDGQLKTGHRK